MCSVSFAQVSLGPRQTGYAISQKPPFFLRYTALIVHMHPGITRDLVVESKRMATDTLFMKPLLPFFSLIFCRTYSMYWYFLRYFFTQNAFLVLERYIYQKLRSISGKITHGD